MPFCSAGRTSVRAEFAVDVTILIYLAMDSGYIEIERASDAWRERKEKLLSEVDFCFIDR